MKAGARKDAMTPEGRTALHIAAQNGHTQVCLETRGGKEKEEKKQVENTQEERPCRHVI
jgi:hypothetical protein